MTKNNKALIKSTILGLLGGSTAAAMYAMNSAKSEKSDDPEFASDEIYVPLSRRNFLKAVRPERLGGAAAGASKSDAADVGKGVDVSGMSPRDMAALKRELLKKKASCHGGSCSTLRHVDGPTASETVVRTVSGAGSTQLRDEKGRFLPGADTCGGNCKKAGVRDDARAMFMDGVGALGGTIAGLTVTKLVTDKILVNKKKKQVERARRQYADALAREVNDVDLPYYNSKAASDRGIIGSTIGTLGLAGLATTSVAGLVMYRIMENRRKEEERAKDKDLAKYPSEKFVQFRFPDVPPGV